MNERGADRRRLDVFISYAVRDIERIEQLEQDLSAEGHAVRRDVRTVGGDDWWVEICQWIREADVVVFCVSPTSVKSRYCTTEIEFAVAMDRPIIPVTVLKTDLHVLPAGLRSIEVVDYRWDQSKEGLALFRALDLTQLRSLPDPRPPDPPVPVPAIQPLRDIVTAPSLPGVGEQASVVERLEAIVDAGDDLALDVILAMRGHGDLAAGLIPRLDALRERARDPTAPKAVTKGILRAIITASKRPDTLVPIIGNGITDSLLGPRRELARELARRHSFPMSRHLREDLAQVTQFVSITASQQTLYDDLETVLRAELAKRLPADAAIPTRTVDEMLAAAWDSRDQSQPDPHALLADLPCRIYVTTHPSTLLEHALKGRDREPVTHVFKWDTDVRPADWPVSRLDLNDGYVPSCEEPLVLHAFGVLSQPRTLVLTEDDHFKFLIAAAGDYRRIPVPVQGALASGMLLVMGFRLEDWDFRTLWRALTTPQGVGTGSDKHVAAQVDLTGSAVSPEDAHDYLEKYFGPRSRKSDPPLEIFWGSVTNLVRALSDERAVVA